MRRWEIGAVAVGGLVAAGAAAVGVATARWDRATADVVARLHERARAAPGGATRSATYDPAQLAGLPPPVARYLALALTPGQPRVRRAHVRWDGAMQLRPGGGWFPFAATQEFTVGPPGFVWDATARMVPLVPVRVRDAYVAGQGAMLGRIGALVPVVDAGGTPTMAAGALTRWLGEAAWMPTAFLPGEGIAWTPIDDRSARATLTDAGVTVTADFEFAPGGALVRMTALRFRDVDGVGVATPFEGIYRAHARRDGMLVPTEAEVAWLLPEGRYPYWRGRLAAVRYDAPGGW